MSDPAIPNPGPASKASPRKFRRIKILLGIFGLVSIPLWIFGTLHFQESFPEERFQAHLSSLEKGEDLDQIVAVFCESDRGRTALSGQMKRTEGFALDRLERAVFQRSCPLLSEDQLRLFFRRHGDWALEDAPKVGETIGVGRLLDVAEHGETPAVRRSALVLLGARLGETSTEEMLDAQRLALNVYEYPWGLALIDQMLEPKVTLELWNLYVGLSPPELRQEDAENPQKNQKDSALKKNSKKNPKKDAVPDVSTTPLKGKPSSPKERSQRLLSILRPRLLSRWSDLPEEARATFVHHWLTLNWVIRRAGSAIRPQPIMLEVRWRAHQLDGPLANAILSVRPTAFTVNKKPLKLPTGDVASLFGEARMSGPSRWQRIVDIQPAFRKGGHWKLAAEIDVALLPAEAKGIEVRDPESGELLEEWKLKALFTEKIQRSPRRYRVYKGAESGGPKTRRSKKITRQIKRALEAELHLSETIPLRKEGEIVTHKAPYSCRHEITNELLLTRLEPLGIDLAFRVQARPGNDPRESWRDLGRGTFREGEDRTAVSLNFGSVCSSVGPCKIGLRLRASLLIARENPKITRYWGDHLELGFLELDLQNAGPGHQWRELQRQASKQRPPL